MLGEHELDGKPEGVGGQSATGTGGRGSGATGGAGGSGCTSDADCAASASGAVCDVETTACVQCTPAEDVCPVGEYCTSKDACEVGCSDDAHCAVTGADAGADAGAVLTCEVRAHACFGCAADADCPPGTLCDVATTRCRPGCTPEHHCQPEDTCCGDTCANLAADAQHCGACATPCDPPHAEGACNEGSCGVESCDPGFGDCNEDPADGCESDLASDALDCGKCGVSCAGLQNAAGYCLLGQCTLGPCLDGFGDCNGVVADGCEAHLTTSAANCGSCGNACSLLNANGVCDLGTCALGSCLAGFADCDGMAPNGCEVDTQKDVSNCGACGKTCAFENAGASCQGGFCVMGTCASPFANCDVSSTDGCEANLNADALNCGACGKVCALAHATATCSAGICTVSQCQAGFADCDGDPANGCEVNLSSSTQNCGSCGHACVANNGAPICSLGACVLQCNPGYADCDNNVANGCEANTQSSVADCGVCGKVCPALGGVPKCDAGVCGVAACVAGRGDCDGSAANGCEADLMTDPKNCGGCGVACFAANGSAVCTAGVCSVASCKPGYANCNGSYADGCEASLTTLTNCGGCNVACALPHATSSCSTGSCHVASCTPPYANCDGMDATGCEVDTSSNPAACGGCGHVCNSTNGVASCAQSACGITCNAGYDDCNSNVADGCETAITNNPAACGACGVVCAVSHGNAACNVTTCAIGSCTSPFADCDGLYATGCEINTQTNVASCGACGAACSANNGTPSCAGGACSIACNPGYSDCDGMASDGCEVMLATSPQNCGACGRACSSTNVASVECAGGVCDSTCAVGFGNCSQPAAPAADDGCERDLTSSATSCGACGHVCPSGFVCQSSSCRCDADADCNAGTPGTCSGGFCKCGPTTCAEGNRCQPNGSCG